MIAYKSPTNATVSGRERSPDLQAVAASMYVDKDFVLRDEAVGSTLQYKYYADLPEIHFIFKLTISASITFVSISFRILTFFRNTRYPTCSF